MKRLLYLALLGLLFLAAPMSSFAEEADCSNIKPAKAVQASPGESATQDQQVREQSRESDPDFMLALGETRTQYGCCKICRVGKACGNSCINRYYNCHQPPGCACDAD